MRCYPLSVSNKRQASQGGREHRREYFHPSQIQFDCHQPGAFEMLRHAYSRNHRSTHGQFHLALAMFRSAGICEKRLVLASHPALLRRSHIASDIHRRDASVTASQTREGLDTCHGQDQLVIWPNRHQHPCGYRIPWRNGHPDLLENATQGHHTCCSGESAWHQSPMSPGMDPR